MNDDQDAFGHLVYDYPRGGAVQEVVERDDGAAGLTGGPALYFAPYPEWPLQCREAMRHVRGRVLDVGCGAGRHALYLQDHGFDVLGIDVSPLAIEVCRRRGLAQACVLDVAAIAAGATVGADLGTFDTILMLGANFGLFGGAAQARRLLARFHEMTGPAARIIAESKDPHALADPRSVAYRDANRRRGRLPGQMRLRVRHDRYVTPWFDYLFVSQSEMKRLLAGSGWRVAHVIDGVAAEYVAVVEKTNA